MNSQKQKQWREMLAICMLDLKQLNPYLNDGEVADKIGIPRPTFNRLKNSNKKGSSNVPSESTIIKLLVGSNNESLVSTFPDLVENGIGKALIGNATKNGETPNMDDKFMEDDELEHLFKDRDVFLAYELASIKNGTDKERLLGVLGSPGVKAMNILVKKGIVYQEDGRYLVKKFGLLVRSYEQLKKQLKVYVEHYRPDLFGKKGNYLHAFSSGLNDEGLKAIRNIHCEFYKKLKQAYRNKEYRGTRLSFSGGFCDELKGEIITQTREAA